MDIKNILNEGDTRVAASVMTASQEKRSRRPELSETPVSMRRSGPSPAPFTSHRTDVSLRRPAVPFASQPILPPPLFPPLSTPAPLPQQIFYTGPVYQLQPTVEVRHLGSTIQYRYGPYPTCEDPAHVDYAIYQEYEEIPRRCNITNNVESRYDRLSIRSVRPVQSISAAQHDRDGHLVSRETRGNDDDIEFMETHVRHRPRGRHYGGERGPGHDVGRATVRREVEDRGCEYDWEAEGPPESLEEQRASRRARLSHRPVGFSRAYPPAARSYRRATVEQTMAQPSAMESRTYGIDAQASYADGGPDPGVSYVSYRGPTFPSVHTFPRRTTREFHTYTEAHENDAIGNGAALPHPRADRRSRSYPCPQTLQTAPDHSEQTSSLHLDPHFSADSRPLSRMVKGHRSKKRERASKAGAVPAKASPATSRDAKDTTVMRNNALDRRSQPRRGSRALHAPSLSRDAQLSEQSAAPVSSRKNGAVTPGMAPNNEPKVSRKKKTASSAARMRTPPRSEEPSRRKHDHRINRSTGCHSAIVCEKKDCSPMSIGDSSVCGDELLTGAVRDVAEISSCHDSEIIQIFDNSDEDSDQDMASSGEENGRGGYVVTPTSPKTAASPGHIDPNNLYPKTYQDFSGIPSHAVGDLLQLWEFVTAFSKTIRLSSFTLRHLIQAIVHMDRSLLIDACLERLVRGICADEGLVKDLGIPDSVVKTVTGKNSKNVTQVILGFLPQIVSFESDDRDDDFLHSTVEQLANSPDKSAFHRIIEPAGKLRILRELVHYATMTDSLRECVTDSLEHADEERKKAREENASSRRKAEAELRDLKRELLDYRMKNGLLESPAESDREREKKQSRHATDNDDRAASADKQKEVLSRKQKLLAAKREREEEEERRTKERGAEAIVAKIDRLRASLKTLRNIRLRNRISSCSKDGDTKNSKQPIPVMPFSAPHEDPVRTHPLGTDRAERCYWFFEGSCHLWIEEAKGGWSTINDAEGLESLCNWLSPTRTRERRLRKRIRERKQDILAAMNKEAKRIEIEENEGLEVTECERPFEPRVTRAGKRKASLAKAQKETKAKKSRGSGSFLDYRNLQR